jgi:ferredoxin
MPPPVTSGKQGDFRQVLVALLVFFTAFTTFGQQRFPPPDFESGYKLPLTRVPPPRSIDLEYVDVAVLAATMGLACYLVLQRRSRKGVLALSLFSLGYFGFYREGCICAIGSVQNVALSLFDSRYALPLTALTFFVLPLAVALFAGRAFCAAVCPHGALQDAVLLKPIKVPSWLEHGLGLVPYFYLGAALVFAATGSAFVICRYDPFVPLFRLSGSAGMLVLGGALLALGIFVGRPYCRFLCPYGALLKLAAKVSKWRVTITPDVCTQCRLCEEACPYGAIHEPSIVPLTPESLRVDRRRLTWVVFVCVILLTGGSWLGAHLGVQASRVNPTVALAERYLVEKSRPVPLGVQTAAALALARAEHEGKDLVAQAVAIRGRFHRAGWIFGAWVAVVISVKLVALCLRYRRVDYEPDRGNCLACARCFKSCPNERHRCGLLPVSSPFDNEATAQANSPAADRGSPIATAS